jgi:hypothetical protein
MGVMINIDNTMQEIEFTGENPNLIIGEKFKMLSPFNLFGLTFVGFLEKGEKINELASKIYGNEIKGRFYLAVMCPITNKKFWSIDIEFIKNLLILLKYLYGSVDEKNKIEELEKELNDDKLKNPFFLIKKYCV